MHYDLLNYFLFEKLSKNMILIPREKEIQQLMQEYNTMQNNSSLQIRFVCREAGKKAE
jgi:hypothetical protein